MPTKWMQNVLARVWTLVANLIHFAIKSEATCILILSLSLSLYLSLSLSSLSLSLSLSLYIYVKMKRKTLFRKSNWRVSPN